MILRRFPIAWVVLAIFAAALRAAAAQPVDLLILAADDATLQPLVGRLASPRIETRAAWTFWLGQLDGKTVALARTEGDPLNAVAATTLAIRLHPPRLIFCYGIARAHDPALRPSDVVIAENFAAFDGLVSPPTALGGGSDPLKWEKLPHALISDGDKENYVLTFPADPAARDLALTITAPHGRVLRGILGSAHQINREPDRVAFLREQWHTSTEDGESAHIAGCAALLGVPIIGARVVDGGPADAADFAARFIAAWK
jgi:adenosylhomocysteine nucleosidase